VNGDGRPSPARPIAAVTFDFWNTLVLPDDDATRRARRLAVQAVLGDFGHEVADEVLDDTFRRTFDAHHQSWVSNRQFTARHGGELVASMLELDLDEDQREIMIVAYGQAAADLDMQLTEHLGETLAALSERGIKLGIICDVGLTPSTVLRGWLDDRGVLDLFDHWSFSDDVGWYKPAPEIFDHALAGLGVAAERTAHVGDLRRTDVGGAQAMGMTAVRYRGAFDDPAAPDPNTTRPLPEGDVVIDDHAELAEALGLA
jgi:FMN phosphatase YigB (HAD superfamily)